jgi:YD repeat-containing protein
MKKYFLNILLGLCSFATNGLYGQALDLENVFPPSPTAAGLGKFATTSVNYADGAAGYNIPLYEYKTNNLSIPIGLTYNTNGTRVTQVASRVGLGWNLNAGGVVSRMVLGEPDGSSTFLRPPTEQTDAYSAQWQSFLERAGNEGYDTQPDIFTFSFGGYSGKFIIDGSQVVKLDENNLIITGGVTNGFTIITPDGAKYEFKQEESSLSISSCAKGVFSRVPIDNAWYLTQVSHPKGDTVYIKYETCDYSYYSSTSQVMSANTGNDNSCPVGCPSVPAFQECQIQMRNYGVYPKIITSNKLGTVLLGYTSREDLIGDYCLSSVIVLDTTVSKTAMDVPVNQQKIRTAYELGYIYSSAGTAYRADIGKRMFLGSVIELNMESLGSQARSYAFEYDRINSLPARTSHSQDYMGFYNGKSNANLIAQPTDPTILNYFPGRSFGNRKPDAAYGKIGTLTKIVFPSGGYDLIEYEGHSIRSTTVQCLEEQSERVYVEGTSDFKQTRTYYSMTFTVPCNQVINLNVGNVIITPNYPANSYRTTACLVDGAGDPCSGESWSVGGDEHQSFTITKQGTYVLSVTVFGPARGYASLNYAPLDTSSNRQIPGVRVSKITTFDPLSGKGQVKRYFYTMDGKYSSGEAINSSPSNIYGYEKQAECPNDGQQGQCLSKVCSYVQLSSSSFYDLCSYSGNHIYYRYVLESDGENMEKGGTEREFTVFFDQSGQPFIGYRFPGAPLSNFAYANGQKIAERTLARVDTTLKVVREEKSWYGVDPRVQQTRKFFAVKRDPTGSMCFTNTGMSSIMNMKATNAIIYDMNNRWVHLDSTRVTVYDKNTGALSSINTLTYNNLTHQFPTSEKTQDSEGLTVETQKLYANDSVTGLNAGELAGKQALKNLNINGALIQEKVIRNGAQVSLIRNNYSIFNSSMPLLASIDAQFGNGLLEKRVIHDKYDIKGNLLVQYKTGGPKMSYVWDYNASLPVAQCTNADVEDIAFTSFEGNSHGSWSLGSTAGVTSPGITGSKSYNLVSGNLARSGLQSGGQYIVSYWAKTGTVNVNNTTSTRQGPTVNGWTYTEKVVTGTSTVTISGTAIIDEVRLYPVGAQMISYTYSPLAGITSQADASSKITYYEYDKLGRLVRIKDQDGKILKQHDYQYQQPVTQ